MGSSDSKLDASVATTSSRSSAAASIDSTDAVLVRAPCGVKLAQVDGNNFLGRLADAKRFANGGGGGGIRLISSLPQRLARAVDKSGGSAGSADCLTPPAAPAGSGQPCSPPGQSSMAPATSTPIWSLTGGHYQYHHHQRYQTRQNYHDRHRHHHQHRQQQRHPHRPHQQNLTALLVRGFDPQEYEKREEHHRKRVARTLSKQQQQQQQQQQQDMTHQLANKD
ncbi:hypothetical protein BOX15_Mlig003771g1 [Macrostomum lignano]|uniref:Uncharacterized protein n=1 Tax=Macrostomum lignano TaxID=282301 RepID=A0A267GSW6_9PLAT|nr:hypothetical protein BOX15_Mlig003771g1 [Macrostomum lignano]